MSSPPCTIVKHGHRKCLRLLDLQMLSLVPAFDVQLLSPVPTFDFSLVTILSRPRSLLEIVHCTLIIVPVPVPTFDFRLFTCDYSPPLTA